MSYSYSQTQRALPPGPKITTSSTEVETGDPPCSVTETYPADPSDPAAGPIQIQCQESQRQKVPSLCIGHMCPFPMTTQVRESSHRNARLINVPSRCVSVPQRLIPNATGYGYSTDPMRSPFCAQHGCPAEGLSNTPCREPRSPNSSSQYCPTHRCTTERRQRRCPKQIEPGLFNNWPICRDCDAAFGCPQRLSNGKRCNGPRVRVNSVRPVILFCDEHICQKLVGGSLPLRCLQVAIRRRGFCEEHSQCPWKIGRERCERIRLRNEQPPGGPQQVAQGGGNYCTNHTCRFRLPGVNVRCGARAESWGGTCEQHRT
ncbi:hypothetical protein DL98DRAFT_216174 [Cadophora sp. DSE1049]|nr:hypothetical protein DL98DRAFT_216174 [Cadophora sp. DSE1049]